MDSVLKSSSGGHSKMSPNLNARGLELGETPLRRWGGYRGSFIVSVGHRNRRRNAKLSIAVHMGMRGGRSAGSRVISCNS